MTDDIKDIIKQSAKGFATKYILPNVMKWDESQEFPIELFKKLGEYGFMGILIPQKYGGSELSYNNYVDIISEISQIDPSIGLSIAAHNSLCTNHIYKFGNDSQKEYWLPKLSSGECIGAWAITEAGSGSDSANMQTTAVKSGDKWILNGSKLFITHGKSSGVMVVIARTGKIGQKNNTSAFIIDRDTEGLGFGKKENKLGMRASETCEVILNNCEISEENILGKVGDGFVQAMKILDGGRISIAALSLGISKGAYKAALKYSKERKQFGKLISEFQAISFKLVDMEVGIEASQMLINNAIESMENSGNIIKTGAICKLFASQTCVEISNNALQIFGGYGYTKDFPVEKFYRDSKLCTIGEGTSEIQKIVIARQILK